MRDRYGGPEIVSVRQVDRPTPREGEVLVRVEAASVNRADLDFLYPRWQFIRLGYGLRAPKAAARYVGSDVAGVVEAVGEDVTALKVGDKVFSDLSTAPGRATGAFAEYVRAPEKALATMPDGWSFEDAACLPHSAVIAIHAHHPLRRWLSALNRRGVYVAYAGSTWWLVSSAVLGPIFSRVTGKRVAVGFIAPFAPAYVEELKKLATAGVLRPVIDRRYSLDEIVDALRYVDQGKASGKVIVTP